MTHMVGLSRHNHGVRNSSQGPHLIAAFQRNLVDIPSYLQ